jgi:hypothetical protein
LCDPLVMKDLLVFYFTYFSLVTMSALPILPPLQLADCYAYIIIIILYVQIKSANMQTKHITYINPKRVFFVCNVPLLCTLTTSKFIC